MESGDSYALSACSAPDRLEKTWATSGGQRSLFPSTHARLEQIADRRLRENTLILIDVDDTLIPSAWAPVILEALAEPPSHWWQRLVPQPLDAQCFGQILKHATEQLGSPSDWFNAARERLTGLMTDPDRQTRERLDDAVANLIWRASKLGHVMLVSNARDPNWPSCALTLCLPKSIEQLLDINGESLPLICTSADPDLRRLPNSERKARAFFTLATAWFPKASEHRTAQQRHRSPTNVVSIGDSESERVALWRLQTVLGCNAKYVVVASQNREPCPEALPRELETIESNLRSVILSRGTGLFCVPRFCYCED